MAAAPGRRAGEARLQPRRDVRPDRRAARRLRELLRRRLSDRRLRQLRRGRQPEAAQRAAGVPAQRHPRDDAHASTRSTRSRRPAADNSIMTTTPSVADVLGGPTTGEPGVFPDQINLGASTRRAAPPQPHARPGDPSRRLAVRELVPDRRAAGRRPHDFDAVRAVELDVTRRPDRRGARPAGRRCRGR